MFVNDKTDKLTKTHQKGIHRIHENTRKPIQNNRENFEPVATYGATYKVLVAPMGHRWPYVGIRIPNIYKIL